MSLYKGTQLISGAIPDMANQSLSNLNSAGQDKFDAKVSKSGDTMTGDLTITKSAPTIVFNDSDYVLGTPPASNTNHKLLTAFDNSNHRMCSIENSYWADGHHAIKLGVVKDANEDAWSVLEVGFNTSNNAYCSFPDTTRVDGQWVRHYQEAIGSSAQTINSGATKNITFTDLPAKICEVMFTIVQSTNYDLGIYSDLIGGIANRALRQGCTNMILPVSSNKTIKIYNLGSGTASINLVRMAGYRVLGTNTNT